MLVQKPKYFLSNCLLTWKQSGIEVIEHLSGFVQRENVRRLRIFPQPQCDPLSQKASARTKRELMDGYCLTFDWKGLEEGLHLLHPLFDLVSYKVEVAFDGKPDQEWPGAH
jgi:hypothetical protein